MKKDLQSPGPSRQDSRQTIYDAYGRPFRDGRLSMRRSLGQVFRRLGWTLSIPSALVALILIWGQFARHRESVRADTVYRQLRAKQESLGDNPGAKEVFSLYIKPLSNSSDPSRIRRSLQDLGDGVCAQLEPLFHDKPFSAGIEATAYLPAWVGILEVLTDSTAADPIPDVAALNSHWYLWLGRIHARQSMHYREWRALASVALRRAVAQKDQHAVVNAYIELAASCVYPKVEMDMAWTYLARAETLLASASFPDNDSLYFLHIKSLALIKTNQFTRALETNSKFFSLLEARGNPPYSHFWRAEGHKHRGIIYREQGKVEQALQEFDRALTAARAHVPDGSEPRPTALKADIEDEIGQTYSYLSRTSVDGKVRAAHLARALEHYRKSLELTRPLEKPQGIAFESSKIAEVLQALGRPLEAIPYLRDSAEKYRHAQDMRTRLEGVLNELAQAYEAVGKADSAEACRNEIAHP